MNVIIGSDHAGYQMKEKVIAHLLKRGIEVEDMGTHDEESVDYTDFGRKVASKVSDASFDRGILMCGTGLGMSMIANRFVGVRAALCNDLYSAVLSRQHNDANVLCLGGRMIGPQMADRILEVFLATAYEGGRHERRVAKIEE